MSSEVTKAAAWLRSRAGSSSERARAERCAALLEAQAREIDKCMRIYADQAGEIIDLRAQLSAVKAVTDPMWGVAP